MSFLFPIIYSAALTYLVWKAFKVMSNGWGVLDKQSSRSFNTNIKQKKYTIHPELLDKSGNITQEELLTVRFSNDSFGKFIRAKFWNQEKKLFLR